MIKYLLKLLFGKTKEEFKFFLPISNTKEDKADERDIVVSFEPKSMPSKYIIPDLPPIRNQKSLSSCASHAAIGCYEIQLSQNRFIEGSELFHYYNARKFVNNQYPKLSGMTIRDACKTLYEYGYTFESLWPYNTNKANEEPSRISYIFSKIYKVKSYQRLITLEDIKASLLEDIPVMVGIRANGDYSRLVGNPSLYDPQTTQGGGHAVILVGYDNNKSVFIIRNHWSPYWGNKGNFEMTYDSFEKTSFDSWRILI